MEDVNFDLFPELLDFSEDLTLTSVESPVETKEASDFSSNSSLTDFSPVNMDDVENQVRASSPLNSNTDNKMTVVAKTPDAKVLTVKICSAKDLQMILPQKTLNSSASNNAEKKGNAISKNAIAARENRLKKKKYIEDLENSVTKLQNENAQLKMRAKESETAISKLRKENAYLRNVVANASELSALLKNIGKTEGIQFSSSLNGKRKSSEDVMNENKKLRVETEAESKENVGVCLHVSNKRVSLEFCSSCNENANES